MQGIGRKFRPTAAHSYGNRDKRKGPDGINRRGNADSFFFPLHSADIFFRLVPGSHQLVAAAKAPQAKVRTGAQNQPALFSAGAISSSTPAIFAVTEDV